MPEPVPAVLRVGDRVLVSGLGAVPDLPAVVTAGPGRSGRVHVAGEHFASWEHPVHLTPDQTTAPQAS